MDSPDQPRCTLFVSYAHEDRKMVEELRNLFIPLERSYGCTLFWDDSKIRAGEPLRQRIDEAMVEARFAVLLLSSDFMGSSFINDNELPRLLERERIGELTILPMLICPVDTEQSGLSHLQFFNPPERPLKTLKTVQREDWFLQVAQRVKELLLMGTGAPDTTAAVREAAEWVPETIGPAQGSANPDALPDETGSATWKASIPPHMAVAEIENQLVRLKQHTRSRGFAVFDREATTCSSTTSPVSTIRRWSLRRSPMRTSKAADA